MKVENSVKGWTKNRITQLGIDMDGQGEDYAVGVHHLFPNEKGLVR